MDLTHHCELCDNQKSDLKIGISCGLTDRKPEFNRTCAKIELNDKFENKLKAVNIEYENLKRKKVLTYLYFAVFLVIGIVVIGGGYLFGKYILERRVISTVPLIIMGVGLAPLGMAFGTLNKHRQDLQLAKNKKDKIDRVLEQYRIEYDLDIQFGKEIHGSQEVSTDLKFRGRR